MAEDVKNEKDEVVEQKRQLIIVKAKQISLRSAEQFLRNRSWEVTSTTELKTALPAILNGNASFILLTVEHSNPKVMKLPQIINHTLKTPIIYFAEGLGPMGPASLNELKYPYVIYPPVSGPAIERMILKIERDTKIKLESEAETETRQADLTRTKEEVIQQTKKAREEMARVFGGDANSDMDFFAHQKGSSGAFTANQQSNSSGPLSAEQESPSSSLNFGKLDGAAEAAEKVAKQTGLSSAHAVRDQHGDDVRSYLNNESFPPPDAGRPAHDSNVFGKKQSQGKNIIVGLDKSKDKTGDSSSPSMGGSEYPTAAGAKTIVLPGNGVGKVDSILIQGAQHAVERVAKDPDAVQHLLGTSTKLHCFFVESPDKFRGYVLVAYAANKDLEKKFKEDLKKTFLRFIKSSGLKIEVKDPTDISIIEVDFEEWSLKESEFLVKSVHEGAEVAVTFFPVEEGHRTIEPTQDGKMLSVPIQEIEADVPLEFDLYLYLPSNRKYFHYTKKNGSLSKEQKERLISSQKDHLHVLPEEKEKIVKQRTEKFVNEKIKEHKKKKAA